MGIFDRDNQGQIISPLGPQPTSGGGGAVTSVNGLTGVVVIPTFTPKKERFVLSGTNITNQYLDLTQVAQVDSIDFKVKGLPPTLENTSDDYSVSYTGGAGGKTRITFLNDLATGGPSALIAGNIVQVSYGY